MGYATVEARVQTLLQGLTSVFSSTSMVACGNWKVLDRGYDRCAVIYPGNFSETGTPYAPGGDGFIWSVNVEIFHRWTDSAYSDFGQMRDSVLQHLQKYPTLNSLADTVLLPSMNGGDIREIYDKDGNGPFFLSQVIALQASEIVTVTIAE